MKSGAVIQPLSGRKGGSEWSLKQEQAVSVTAFPQSLKWSARYVPSTELPVPTDVPSFNAYNHHFLGEGMRLREVM